MVLLFLESIGTTELLVILVVALVVFGPRRLPELGRKLAKGMGEFRRVSDDFKRTWEREVDLDRYERESKANLAMLPGEETPAVIPPADSAGREPLVAESVNSVARGSRAAELDTAPEAVASDSVLNQEPAEQSARKSDWL